MYRTNYLCSPWKSRTTIYVLFYLCVFFCPYARRPRGYGSVSRVPPGRAEISRATWHILSILQKSLPSAGVFFKLVDLQKCPPKVAKSLQHYIVQLPVVTADNLKPLFLNGFLQYLYTNRPKYWLHCNDRECTK